MRRPGQSLIGHVVREAVHQATRYELCLRLSGIVDSDCLQLLSTLLTLAWAPFMDVRTRQRLRCFSSSDRLRVEHSIFSGVHPERQANRSTHRTSNGRGDAVK